MNKLLEKRIPIRRRVSAIVLLTMSIALFAASVTGVFCIRWIKNSSENALRVQLESNLKSIVKQKVVSADARLEHYEKYIEFVTDFIEGMYQNEERMISLGRIYEAPRDSREYALTRGFASEAMKAGDFEDEILFFSNLEQIWAPIARANENLITTVYAGSRSGLLTSYDRWSYLSVPEEGRELVYDYFQSGWYTQGLEEEGVFYTGLYVDSQGRGLTITVASPFRSPDGEVMGVDCADFDITALFDELLSIDLGEGAFSFTLDRDGAIISPDAHDKTIEAYTGLSPEGIEALKRDPDGILETPDAVYVCIPIERVGWTLCACVPTGMIQKSIREADRSILYAFMTFIGVALLILLCAIVAINRVASTITHPMEQLGRDMKIITEGNLDYRATVYRNDEIGDITSQMNEMVDRLKFTMSELVSSRQHADAMSELATRDSLTGVRNKTAFDAEVGGLVPPYGLVMIDLNNLKMINDNYGHDKGDMAIRKLAGIICDVFEHSPVFRVGGDEFVVVLKDRDYRDVASHVARFKRMAGAKQSQEPWEHVSAAIGYALFDAKTDAGADAVLKRADMQMYRCKNSMKQR